jgi:hypothetical protein
VLVVVIGVVVVCGGVGVGVVVGGVGVVGVGGVCC